VLPGPNDDAAIGPAAAGQPTATTLAGKTTVRSVTASGVTLRLADARPRPIASPTPAPPN
jgi:hypothetical protein